jgi:hypothetical protein
MSVSSLVTGAVAGLGATLLMTLAMEVMPRSLPQHERYPLPPREITEELVAQAGAREQLNRTTQDWHRCSLLESPFPRT